MSSVCLASYVGVVVTKTPSDLLDDDSEYELISPFTEETWIYT
jgi:hypothetical protein